MQFMIGWSCIFFTAFSIITNMVPVIFNFLNDLKLLLIWTKIRVKHKFNKLFEKKIIEVKVKKTPRFIQTRIQTVLIKGKAVPLEEFLAEQERQN
jgi:predicted membrane protein